MKLYPKVLFILKKNDNYGWAVSGEYSAKRSSGLLNSARFINEMLPTIGIQSKLVQVTDNNDIDREVTEYNPSHVIIEALWVVPEKFAVLQNLHPTVKWIVRLHSELPFLANEGVAIDWICQYARYDNVYVSANSEYAMRDIAAILKNAATPIPRVDKKLVYLPNYYPCNYKPCCSEKRDNGYIDVACFGAIRPLKNHLLQANAAIQYANAIHKILRFHVNSSRIEQAGDNTLRNLRALFKHNNGELVEHPWMEHCDFMEVLRGMDIGLQVSFTESFNIVAADMVMAGMPIVVSPEITWASNFIKAEPTNSNDIVEKMFRATGWRTRRLIQRFNLSGLRDYTESAKAVWSGLRSDLGGK